MRNTLAGLLVILVCCAAADNAHAQERPPKKFRKENSFLGFGIGLFGYWPDIQEISAAFTAIEDGYRASGYTISGHSSFETMPLVSLSARIQMKSRVGFVLETEQTLTDDKIQAISGTILIELRDYRGNTARPFIGAGATHMSFEFTCKYGNRISPVGPNGEYQTLNEIVATGNQLGANLVGGVQFVSLNVRLNVQVSYWYFPELSKYFYPGEKITLNMSSFVLGAQLMFTFP